LANDKKIELSFAIERGCPPRIETDARRLQQIITNLVSNAVKFTERGSVRLRGVAGPDDQLVISVEDTGIGIPATHHQTIFEAFRQADGVVQGGTGLGLSICRELANLLGGEIDLKSAPGAGSTFTVVLPRRPGKSANRVRGTRPGSNSDKS